MSTHSHRRAPHRAPWAAAAALAAAILAALALLLPAAPAPAAATHTAATPAHAIHMCHPLEKHATNARSGRYIIYNQTMGTTAQCLTTTGHSQFTVTLDKSSGPYTVHAYPDIYYGCTRRVCSPGTILPMRVRALPRITTGWRYKFGNCLCNAAYDLWFSRRGNTNGHPSGPEMMIWLGTRGHVEPDPATHGWHEVQIDGTWWWLLTWKTYDPSFGHWTYIQFCRARQTTHAVLDLRPFMREAERAGLLSPRSYLRSVDAGFETWKKGTGDATEWFKVRAGAS